jgi:dihydroorotate dehydrogenase electron transfer subunit
MKQRLFEIKSNEQIAKNVYRMQLGGDTVGILPGQFVNIRVEGQFLRRPISVCNITEAKGTDGVLTIIYKVVGVGTEAMSHLPVGTQLDVLTVLGNGYDLSKAGEAPLLVGGGVGVPPIYMLARQRREAGKKVRVILGFNT